MLMFSKPLWAGKKGFWDGLGCFGVNLKASWKTSRQQDGTTKYEHHGHRSCSCWWMLMEVDRCCSCCCCCCFCCCWCWFLLITELFDWWWNLRPDESTPRHTAVGAIASAEGIDKWILISTNKSSNETKKFAKMLRFYYILKFMCSTSFW